MPRATILRTAGFLFLASSLLSGARLALLVGIRYNPVINHQGFRPLSGPINDVNAMVEVLRDKWHFTEIKVLSGDVKKRDILAALDELAAEVKPGDFVFLYFSGHGTSGLDVKTNYGFGMDRATGALVPWDLKRDGSPKELLDGLIIAARDLRPRLRKLEEAAEVFAAFDACYSGNSIKSVPVAGANRRDGDIVPPGADRSSFLDELRRNQAELSGLTAREAYPYRKVIYMSASAASEPAYDIDDKALAAGKRTFDGKPHGAFSNALIDGLRGAATDPAGTLSYAKLHQYVIRSIEGQYGQSPQLWFDASNPTLVNRAVFGGDAPRPPAAASSGAGGGPLRVKFAVPDAALLRRLKGAANLVLVDRPDAPWDVIVERIGAGGYLLRHSSGGEMLAEGPEQIAEFASAIQGVARAKKLADVTFPGERLHVFLELLPNVPPFDREVFYKGEVMKFRIKPERDAYLLLLNIDRKGCVTVIYPNRKEEARPASTAVETVPSEVQEPVGLETIKAFAFASEPSGYAGFVGRAPFSPDSEHFRNLLDMVLTAKGDKAEFSRLLYSTAAKRPEQ